MHVCLRVVYIVSYVYLELLQVGQREPWSPSSCLATSILTLERHKGITARSFRRLVDAFAALDRRGAWMISYSDYSWAQDQLASSFAVKQILRKLTRLRKEWLKMLLSFLAFLIYGSTISFKI